jgi:hypothetical protein
MDEADQRLRLSNAKRLQFLRDFKLQKSRVELAKSNASLALALRSQDASQLQLDDNIDFRGNMERSIYTSMTGESLSTSTLQANLNEFDRNDRVVAESEAELKRLTGIRVAKEIDRNKCSSECSKHSKSLAKVDFLVDKTAANLEALRETQEEQLLDELSGIKRGAVTP